MYYSPDSEGDVWLAQFEIAQLFGVFVSAVSANIRAIYKSGSLKEYETQRVEKTRDGCYLPDMRLTKSFHKNLEDKLSETIQKAEMLLG